jgi:hypothetical protein
MTRGSACSSCFTAVLVCCHCHRGALITIMQSPEVLQEYRRVAEAKAAEVLLVQTAAESDLRTATQQSTAAAATVNAAKQALAALVEEEARAMAARYAPTRLPVARAVAHTHAPRLLRPCRRQANSLLLSTEAKAKQRDTDVMNARIQYEIAGSRASQVSEAGATAKKELARWESVRAELVANATIAKEESERLQAELLEKEALVSMSRYQQTEAMRAAAEVQLQAAKERRAESDAQVATAAEEARTMAMKLEAEQAKFDTARAEHDAAVASAEEAVQSAATVAANRKRAELEKESAEVEAKVHHDQLSVRSVPFCASL